MAPNPVLEPPGNPEMPEWAREFYRQVEAIALHTAAMVDDQKGIPAMVKIQNSMVDLLKGYEGKNASRGSSGGIPDLGGSSHASRSKLTPDQQKYQKFFGLDDELNPKASVGGTGLRGNQWADRVGKNAGLKIPQIGKFTGQDYLNTLANLAADRAMKIKQRAAEATSAYQTYQNTDPSLMFDDQGGFTPLGTKLHDAAQSASRSAMASTGGKMAGLSNLLGNVEHGYTVSKTLSDMVQRVADPVVNARNLAYITGYQGGGQGPLGFPNLGAVNAGIGQRTSEMGFAFNNNLSPGQAQGIYNNLFGLGWNGGPQTNSMRNALANLTNFNPVLGTNPASASMLDETVRLGQHSIGDFLDVMKKIPDAAHAANLSLAQVTSDMQSMGNFYSSIGGTKLGGMQASQFWNQTTGQSSQILQGFLQNPMVQGQVFMGTGLIPWEQGLATPAQQTQGIFNALNMMNHAVNLPSIATKDAFGVTHTVSRQDQTAALMAKQFGTTPDVIKNLMRHQQGIQAATNILQNAQNYQTDVKNGKFAPNGTQWDLLQKEMRSAVRVDPTTGKTTKIFKPGDVKGLNFQTDSTMLAGLQQSPQLRAMRVAFDRAHWDPKTARETTMGDIHATSGSIDRQVMQWAMKSGKWTPNQYIRNKVAQQRSNFVGKELGNNANQNKGPQITIELGAAAKKVLHLSSPQDSGKAGSYAGGTAVNIPWAQGPSSTPLFSDPNASGGGTWGSSASQ